MLWSAGAGGGGLATTKKEKKKETIKYYSPLLPITYYYYYYDDDYYCYDYGFPIWVTLVCGGRIGQPILGVSASSFPPLQYLCNILAVAGANLERSGLPFPFLYSFISFLIVLANSFPSSTPH